MNRDHPNVEHSTDWNPECRDCDRGFDDCGPMERVQIIFSVWVCTDCYDGDPPQAPLSLFAGDVDA